MSMPAIDADICSGWTQQQIDLFNSLPFYFAKMQVERRKNWTIWNKFCGKRRWEANKGDIMRLVRKEPSPHIRQFAMPKTLVGTPRRDVMDVREVSADVQLYRHRFESPVLNFVPDFRDFMTDHVDAHGNDIMEKIERFEDIYLRSNIYHQAPYMLICKNNDVELIPATQWDGVGEFDAATEGKTTAWLTAQLPNVTGNLSLLAVNKALTIMENDLRVPAFKGSNLPKDGEGLQDKYCLIQESESYNQFTFDPYLQANKNCNLDVVHSTFKGDLFGRMTCKLEDLPLRCTAAGVFHEPELRVGEGLNEGETVGNDLYNLPANSPYGIGFIAGAQGYEAVEVGPPPSKFASDNPPDNFAALKWNAEVRLTKKFLIECIGDDGVVRYEMNTYGENLKFISQGAFGIAGKQRRNIVPIVWLRKRGM